VVFTIIEVPFPPVFHLYPNKIPVGELGDERVIVLPEHLF
jgi:hypothetical protein